jgi:hypothetical protein
LLADLDSLAPYGVCLIVSQPEPAKFSSMKTNQLRWTLRLLLLNAALAVLAAGCATQNERSYNQDFNQNLPTSPKYAIENVDDTHFQITVHQGSPLSGTQRIIYVKEAASAVAATEAKRRGWQIWNLDYIQERDQGWMHIVIADVTRKNAVEMTPGSTQ